MSKVVFDIETRGFEGDELDPIIKENLLKNVVTEEEQVDVLARSGLLPISGEVVAIAMLNPDTNKGKIYFQAPELENKNYEQNGVEFIVATEKEILEKFWLDIKFYDQIITYNGRGFDVPFIIFRSIALGIKPTKNLMPYRYSSKDHFDILDQLTFYGAFRKFSLEVLCRAFGIKNPKEEGVSGLAINDLFKSKDYQTIAEYCMRDVVATKDLYEKVKSFIEI